MPTSSKKKQSWVTKTKAAQKKRLDAFMALRPHRSFQLTRRHDDIRPLTLPGNFSFTNEVTRTFWKYKNIFFLLATVYVLLYALLVGVQSQDTYTTLTDTLKDTSGEAFGGNWGAVGQAGLLFLTIASSGVSTEVTEAQQ